MRYTPCGCRSACLVEVQTNFRLLQVSSMRRAPAMPLFRTQSAAEVASLAPHDSKAQLQAVTTRRDSWRSHVHRTHTAQRVQLFKLQTANVGGRGGAPRPFSWGCKGDILFREREYPPFPRPPHGVGDNRVRPAGAKKEAPFRVLPFYSTVTDFARLRGLSISHPRWSAI